MADLALADRDKEFWSTRVRALASLAASDALAVVLPLPDGRYVSFAEHNVGHDPAWLEGAAQYLVWSAVKQRTVQAPYIGQSWRIGDMRIPMRLLVAFAVALTLTLVLTAYLSRTFLGRAIRAVAQDEMALRLMGANPLRIKQYAFGIATAVLGLAGALLIIVAPVDPTLDRAYIGRTFCVVVMAGLGSMSGTLVAAIILGVAESIVLTLFGASWAPAISFTMLLLVLAVRPQGLFGR